MEQAELVLDHQYWFIDSWSGHWFLVRSLVLGEACRLVSQYKPHPTNEITLCCYVRGEGECGRMDYIGCKIRRPLWFSMRVKV